eukprot:2779512-Pleurochrysis_carterae.AAC.1
MLIGVKNCNDKQQRFARKILFSRCFCSVGSDKRMTVVVTTLVMAASVALARHLRDDERGDRVVVEVVRTLVREEQRQVRVERRGGRGVALNQHLALAPLLDHGVETSP